MTTKSLLHSSLLDNLYYNSMLVGNDAYIPFFSAMEFLGEAAATTGNETTLSFTSGGEWANYEHLQFRLNSRTSDYNIAGGDWLQVTLNSNTAGNAHGYNAGGTGISSSEFGTDSDGHRLYAAALATQDTANFMAFTTLDILDINSSNPKVWKAVGGSAAAAYPRVNINSGIFTGVTSAATSISFTPDSGTKFAIGSRITAYGIKGA